MIEVLKEKWLVIQCNTNYNNVYNKCIVVKLQHNIKVYINNKLEEIPCNISTYTQNIFENKYLKLPDGNIKVICQNNNINKNLKYDIRFIKMGIPWKIVGFTSEHEGLKYIYAEKNSIDTETDDMENEIADRWEHEIKHKYFIEISEEDININVGDIKELQLKVKDTYTKNNEVITEILENPTLIYSSSNNNICTVNPKGQIKGIGEGNAIIKIQFKNIIETININVIKIEKLEIEGKDKIALDRTTTYTSNIKVLWKIEDIDNKSRNNWAKIIKQTDTSCTIQTTSDWIFTDNYNKYFNIIATSKNNKDLKVIKKVKIIAY